MAKYLISFPSAAMVVPDREWEAVGRDAHAVIDEARAAGVYIFVAAPAVMRERDRGSEREQRQQERRRGSHRSPPGASRPTEVNCPSPRGVKTTNSPSWGRSPVAS